MKLSPYSLLCNVFLPTAGGAAGALRASQWHALTHQWWFADFAIWLGFVLFVLVMVETKWKRIITVVVATLWVGAVTISGLYAPQVPDPPRRIAPDLLVQGRKFLAILPIYLVE